MSRACGGRTEEVVRVGVGPQLLEGWLWSGLFCFRADEGSGDLGVYPVDLRWSISVCGYLVRR